MKKESYNIKKTIYLNKSLNNVLEQLAEENGVSFQKTMRGLIHKGLESNKGGLIDYVKKNE